LGENMDELIDSVKENKDKEETIAEYLDDMMSKRVTLLSQINAVIDKDIAPKKEEVSQIEAEIERIMIRAKLDKIKSDKSTAYIKTKVTPQVIDNEKFLEFLNRHPQVLKKDSFKMDEIKKLVKDGIVPDPEIDGIDINKSFQKISFVKR